MRFIPLKFNATCSVLFALFATFQAKKIPGKIFFLENALPSVRYALDEIQPNFVCELLT